MPHTAPKPLIGLHGRARSGKDTVGEDLLQWFAPNLTLCKFAHTLKRMLASMLMVPLEKMEDNDWRETPLPDIGKTPRELMLSLGTEWGRGMVHPDLWVLMEKRGSWASNLSGSLYTDVRFDNEAEWIRSEGGVIIEVVRFDQDGSDGPQHRSEAGISPRYISRTVGAHKGDVAGLRARARLALEELECSPGRFVSSR